MRLSIKIAAMWLGFLGFVCAASAELANDTYHVSVPEDGILSVSRDGERFRFKPRFTVLFNEKNPKAELRWADFPGDQVKPPYNVMTWETGKVATDNKPVSGGHVEDGFDPKSDRKLGGNRTADLFQSASAETVTASSAAILDGKLEWAFPEHPGFVLAATIEVPAGSGEPVLTFRFTPRRAGWFSVGYTGAPEVEPAEMDGMWQPLIWQEKRFPKLPVLTESARCTLPTTFVSRGGLTWGVVADPDELLFMPMPTVANSRFGVAVRNGAGSAQPMLFAPVLGGVGSKMEKGSTFTFKVRLFAARQSIPDSYASLARSLFKFQDYRHNALGSLNRVLERTVDYAMSDWARFNQDLRGCAYDTDVPGSVKNVSSLHPLSVSLVTDNERIFKQRARPIMEYLMSREKFLFTVNPKIKGQGASARLNGPCAPVSELATLYAISGQRSPFFLRSAEGLFGKTRALNLDDPVRGDVWQNALAIYRASGDKAWLKKAKSGADHYIAQRLESAQTDFSDPGSRGMFFWTSFAPNWMELFELYEATGEERYLEAAREGARRFAQFIWLCPVIPDEEVLVNEGGQAPFYRKSDKFKPILLPEEHVEAWRVSEIGLTCESSGTSKGHRGILLATHAPWMLRLAQATGDAFLHDIGRSAVIGRYTSFPGYHMNTARTTVYEKPDFAERPMTELNSTTSLHYNHIWPQAAMLLDYLVADAESRSRGAIAFPSQFAEGYAYLQQQVYGDRPGVFYGDKDVWLWMPKGLLSFDEPEINYVAARSDGMLYLALMNQSTKPISASVRLDNQRVAYEPGKKLSARVWRENKPSKPELLDPAEFRVEVAPNGITAVAIAGAQAKTRFQGRMAGASPAWKQDSAQLELGGTHAMLLNFGPGLKSAYVYLQAQAAEVKQATLHYSTGGDWRQASDVAFPYEFTVPLAADAKRFDFKIETVTPAGLTNVSPVATLQQ